MCGDRATAGGYVQFLIIAGLDYEHVDVFFSWSAALDCSVVPHKATNDGIRGRFDPHSWLCAEKRVLERAGSGTRGGF